MIRALERMLYSPNGGLDFVTKLNKGKKPLRLAYLKIRSFTYDLRSVFCARFLQNTLHMCFYSCRRNR